jgi:hypothetical protein
MVCGVCIVVCRVGLRVLWCVEYVYYGVWSTCMMVCGVCIRMCHVLPWLFT